MSENVKLPRVVPDPLVPEGVVLLLDDERGVRRVVEIVKENDALRAQLTAAEAAREAVLASLAAAEAVAGDAVSIAEGYAAMARRMGDSGGERMARSIAQDIRALISTPSAALQRVREQAQREGAERALRVVWHAPALMKLDSQDEFVTRMLAAMFPTPDAGGPA